MRRFKAVTTIGALAVACALVLGACSSSSSSSGGGSAPSGGTKVQGGVATWAEAPATAPNYIFPFMSLAYFSVANINQFQYLMYRPLYWFGNGATPDLNPSLSLAQAPVYSNGNKTITITLKPYKWSNGETVTADDVMFWMNMMHAAKADWAAYAPGTIPDNVQNVTVNSPTQLTFTLTQAYSPTFYTYNQLSQITPLPMAWDVTSTSGAPNSGGCAKAAYGTADSACMAVYTFLSKEAGYDPANPSGANNSLPTYATNPLWQVVDGPFHLTSFDANGDVTMAPNSSYSGPVKPSISEFKEVPYTTDDAEFNALVAGQLTFGYLPLQDAPQNNGSATVAGANNGRVSSKFYLAPLYTWSINYFPYNFNSSGDNGAAGAIFKQLYVRQAMQELVDQTLYIKKIDKGYGIPTYGPVPVEPPNSFASSYEKNNPYPYNPQKAISLLKSHGWTVTPNGTDTCSNPGTGSNQCGAGIPSGAQLAFNLQYASGNASITQLMNTEKSSWAQAGINITLSPASFDTVIGNATPCSGGSSCSWELENWGAGWVFAPDYYPSGEELFETGAGSNSGSYSDPQADSLIKQTNTSNVSLTQYENYLAQQLPVVYQPDQVTEMSEISTKLRGVLPQDPLWSINPENWYFVK